MCDVLLWETILHPSLDTRRAVESAIVDQGRSRARWLGEQVHQSVDILMRQVDDRKQQGGTGQIRQEAVRIEIGGKIPLALAHVDAVIEQRHLRLFGASQ